MKHPLNLTGHLILGSASPRRAALLQGLGFNFSQLTSPGNEEWPSHLAPAQVAEFLALKKAEAIIQNHPLPASSILLTADTTVLLGNTILNKPESLEDAKSMLMQISGNVHKVISGVCLRDAVTCVSFTEVSQVRVRICSPELIDYYLHTSPPLDKAGAYGIQEFFGMAAIESIKGCYYNIMGLPTAALYEALKQHFHANT